MRLETEQDQIDSRMLEYLYDTASDRTSGVGIGEVIKHYGNDGEARAWIASARDRSLIMQPSPRAYPSYALTPEGRRLVQEARQRRSDAGRRRRGLQCRVLAYVDGKCPVVGQPLAFPSKFPESEFGVLDGLAFTEGEINEAVDLLVRSDLLKSAGGGWGGGHLRVGITHSGRECATDYDHDVAAYMAAQRQTGPSIHMSGEGNALSVALGPHSTATAKATTINIDAALILARAIREALPVLDLGDEGTAALEDIEQAEDQGRIRRGLDWFGQFGHDTSASALGQLIGTAALALAGGG